jgi:hypothetical protein
VKNLRFPRRAAVVLPLVSLSLLVTHGGGAMPPVSVEPHVLLHVEALIADDGPARAVGVSADLEVGPRKSEIGTLRIPWGRAGTPVVVDLAVTLAPSAPGLELVMHCVATVTPAGRPAVKARREIRFSDEGAAIFEVFGDAAGRLVLTIEGERVDRAVAGAIPAPGDPVRFTVAVEGVEGDRSAVLETNELHSFIGQSVEYGFQQGPYESRQAIRLVLLPESVTGDLITIVAEISGVIPGPGGPALLSRSERIVASRLATTTVAATVGTPPAGYRFQITPDF